VERSLQIPNPVLDSGNGERGFGSSQLLCANG
jgi:hypothetical protein